MARRTRWPTLVWIYNAGDPRDQQLMATTRFHLPPILALLDRNGDPNIIDASGHTVLDKLDRNSTAAVADWLEKEGRGTWPWTMNESLHAFASRRKSLHAFASVRESAQAF